MSHLGNMPWKLPCALTVLALLSEISAQTQYKTLSNGASMPVVNLGFWQASCPSRMANTWLKNGNSGIDEAWVYRNQPRCAWGIEDSGVLRSNIFMTSKVWRMDGYVHARSQILETLFQLDMDYVDLMLIHWPQGPDMKGTWRAMEVLVNQGKIKNIGVSNFKKDDIDKLLSFATIKPVVNQIPYNIYEHDESLVEHCHSRGIAIESYSPLGTGQMGIIKNSQLQAIGKKYHKTAAQVAIKWIVQQGHLVAVLASSEKHQQEDVDMFSWSLTSSEMDEISRISSSTSLHSKKRVILGGLHHAV